MGIIYGSALLNSISGRIKDVVYRRRRSMTIACIVSTDPCVPLTARTAQIRANISWLSSLWSNLTPQQKRLWQSHAISRSRHTTGNNSFMSLNGAALNASNTDFTVHYAPPPTPSTPRSIRGLSVSYISPTCACISWAKPLTDSDYVYLTFRLPANFCSLYPGFGLCPTSGYTTYFHFISTVKSSFGSCAFCHDWPAGAKLYFRAKSLDLYGRRSPLTAEIEYTNNP